MRGKLSEDTLGLLERNGWEFVPTDDHTWSWIKFDKNGVEVEREGSQEFWLIMSTYRGSKNV